MKKSKWLIWPMWLLYSFLQLVLPCDDLTLRAKASQRPTYTVSPNDSLAGKVEELLSTIIKKELALAGQTEMLK